MYNFASPANKYALYEEQSSTSEGNKKSDKHAEDFESGGTAEPAERARLHGHAGHLKELKIAKVPDGSAGYRYVVPTDSLAVDVPETSELPLVGVKSLEISGQIAVVKTRPGYASVVASIIDSGQNAEIMGTLAGDDTVLLILRHGAAAQKVLDTISALIPGIQDKLMNN